MGPHFFATVGCCIVEGVSWDCMSAYRLVELGVADEEVPATVYAVYSNGRTKPIGNGLVIPDPLGRAISSQGGSTGGSTGSTGHADDSGWVVLAGTSDSSVTIVAGADYVSTVSQTAQKAPCTFNVNLNNVSRVRLTKNNFDAIEKALNAIFATAGFRATLNNPDAATTADFNYNLTVFNNFPASYPQSARFDEFTIGYTRSTRQIPDSKYPDIYFPGPHGGASVNHIQASYGAASTRPSELAFILAGISAHEMIAHYLLMESGHLEAAEGITRDGFDYRKNSNRYISAAVKAELDKICSSGQLPK
jgi:hypothetical protein